MCLRVFTFVLTPDRPRAVTGMHAAPHNSGRVREGFVAKHLFPRKGHQLWVIAFPIQAGGFSRTRKNNAHAQAFRLILIPRPPSPCERLGGPAPSYASPQGACLQGDDTPTRGVSTSQVSSVGMHHAAIALFYSQSTLETLSGSDAISGCASCHLTRHPQHLRSPSQ